MFIGHFGVGFGAQRLAPRVSLGTLLMSAQLVDLLWPVFLLVGLESVPIDPRNTAVAPLDFIRYPYTHSLRACLGWGLLAGLVYFAVRRDRRGASIVGVAVVSHWFLDWISHRPDMPLLPGGPKVVLGLWNSVAATVLVEGAIFILGLALYLRCTRARDKIGHWSLWSLVLLLAGSYVGDLLGPPPPSEKALAWVGLAMWLLVPLGGTGSTGTGRRWLAEARNRGLRHAWAGPGLRGIAVRTASIELERNARGDLLTLPLKGGITNRSV